MEQNWKLLADAFARLMRLIFAQSQSKEPSSTESKKSGKKESRVNLGSVSSAKLKASKSLSKRPSGASIRTKKKSSSLTVTTKSSKRLNATSPAVLSKTSVQSKRSKTSSANTSRVPSRINLPNTSTPQRARKQPSGVGDRVPVVSAKPSSTSNVANQNQFNKLAGQGALTVPILALNISAQKSPLLAGNRRSPNVNPDGSDLTAGPAAKILSPDPTFYEFSENLKYHHAGERIVAQSTPGEINKTSFGKDLYSLGKDGAVAELKLPQTSGHGSPPKVAHEIQEVESNGELVNRESYAIITHGDKSTTTVSISRVTKENKAKTPPTRKTASPSIQNLIDNNANNMRAAEKNLRALRPQVNNEYSRFDVVLEADGKKYPSKYFGPNSEIKSAYDTLNYDNADILAEIMATFTAVINLVKYDRPSAEDCTVLQNHLKRLFETFMLRRKSLRNLNVTV